DNNGRPRTKGTSLSSEARISLIMFEFSSCLLADSAMNLVSNSSRLGLRSGYEEFPLFRWYNHGPAALYCPLVHAGGQYLFRNLVLRTSKVVIDPDGWFLIHLLAAPVRDTRKARSMI
ncbi:hypothetical protein Tco_1096855, partial [Tanacetum coccineum]